MINLLKRHTSEVISLNWSANGSHEQMRSSDASQIYLTSSSTMADLAVWRLSDLSYTQSESSMTETPYFYEDELFNGPIKAHAWNPTQEGLLAIGGGTGDQIIRIYDFKKNKEV